MKKGLFINRNFLLLWTGKIISLIGDKIYAIALAWWILQKTNSPKTMGFFLLISVLPGLLIGSFAGAVADRSNRKSILVITDFLRGILVFIIAVLSMSQLLTVWHIFMIGAALSVVTSFFDPAIQAVIPQVVEKEALTKANSLNQMLTGICTIIGPILGAGAISLFGTSAVFLFNGISFIVSALLEMMVRIKNSWKNDEEAKTLLEDLKEGLKFLKYNGELIRIILIIAIAHFFMGGLMVLIPFLAKSLHGDGVRNIGILETMLGSGLLLGAISISKKKNVKLKVNKLIYLIMMFGICFLIISVLQFIMLKNVLPFMFAFLAVGCLISGASVFWQSLLQSNTPQHMAGRIFSISTLAVNVSMPLAYAVFGLLSTYFLLKILMLFCGTCLIIFAGILRLGQRFGELRITSKL